MNLLVGAKAATIGDYLSLSDIGIGTRIEVDADGSGPGGVAQTIDLFGVHLDYADIADLISDGSLVIA